MTAQDTTSYLDLEEGFITMSSKEGLPHISVQLFMQITINQEMVSGLLTGDIEISDCSKSFLSL